MHTDTADLYVWAISGGGHAMLGVTDDLATATGHLSQALEGMPPECPVKGTLRRVRTDLQASHPSYIYGPVLMRIGRDKVSGEISFTDIDPDAFKPPSPSVLRGVTAYSGGGPALSLAVSLARGHLQPDRE